MVYRDDSSLEAQLAEVLRRIRVLETQAPVGFTSVSRGALRILSPEGLIVVGTARVTGTQYVDGRLEGDGVFDWSGAVWLRGSVMVPGNLTGVGSLLWSGPWEMRGNGDLTGNVALDGDLSLRNGRIVAGSIIIDKNGGYGGRLAAATLLFETSSALFTGAVTASEGVSAAGGITAISGNIVAAIGGVTALGDIRSTAGDIIGLNKYFLIEHPSKPGHQLRHGSLEGPEHGVYYRGVVEFDANGEALFTLPDYFVSLVLADDEPTVQVTAQGRPFMTGHEPVEDGRVTIYGDPGRKASVTVTAARGRFEVEPEVLAD